MNKSIFKPYTLLKFFFLGCALLRRWTQPKRILVAVRNTRRGKEILKFIRKVTEFDAVVCEDGPGIVQALQSSEKSTPPIVIPSSKVVVAAFNTNTDNKKPLLTLPFIQASRLSLQLFPFLAVPFSADGNRQRKWIRRLNPSLFPIPCLHLYKKLQILNLFCADLFPFIYSLPADSVLSILNVEFPLHNKPPYVSFYFSAPLKPSTIPHF